MEGTIVLTDSQCFLVERFLGKQAADICFDYLLQQVAWQQPEIKIFGQSVSSPRLASWYGDEGAVYRYSGLTNLPLPWLPELQTLKGQLEAYTGSRFNSVLLNLYRDGNDSMGYHSDDEPELGVKPLIASVSLGETRRFLMKHKYQKDVSSVKMDLSHGSLLVMKGETQRYWLHSVPKTKRRVSSRINLTFRWVETGNH